MIDLVRLTLDGAAKSTAWAPLAALGAGVATSFGPCIAPRLMAVASLTAEQSGPKRWTRIGSFVVGLCTSYVLLGSIAGTVRYLSAYSTYMYALLGLTSIGLGVRTIVRAGPADGCSAVRAEISPSRHGALFVAGFALATVASPCCGPVAAALAGISLAGGSAAQLAASLAAFALGHALPLIAVACGSMPLEVALRARFPAAAIATVSGALAIALGSYYALLA